MEKCKIQILGKDPNNENKPARFSSDPETKKQQLMALAACRKGKRHSFAQKVKGKVKKGVEYLKNLDDENQANKK